MKTRKTARWLRSLLGGNFRPGSYVPPLLFLLPIAVFAQTLARPGWSGSGLTVAPWWHRAVLYEVDPARFAPEDAAALSRLRAATSKLDYVHSLGIDAVVLARLQPETSDAGSSSLEAVDPALGTMDDLDDFIREASRDNLRVIVELEPSPTNTPAQLEHAARFWLNRGVAGISLAAVLPAAQMRGLHEIARSFAGQRILIAPAARDISQHADMFLNAQLSTGALDASSLRSVLAGLQPTANQPPTLALTDRVGLPRSVTRFGGGNPEAAKVLAAVLLATRADTQLLFGQELGMAGPAAFLPWATAIESAAKPKSTPDVATQEADSNSPLNWYRRMIDLHHGSSALHAGTFTFLDHDKENALAWVVRPPQVTPLSPAVIVACNLSSKPITLSLTGDLAALHLRGAFLRTILRSSPGMGGMSLNAVTLPPYGVFLGELRF